MKKKDMFFVAFLFVVVFSVIIIKPIDDLDEMWNFNTARVFAEGLVPYRDVSMITTPLLPMMTSVFLRVIANEVIVSRVLAAIVWAGLLFMVFKILRILVKEENTSLIFTALVGVLCRDIFCIDYNIFVLFISLVILYNELKNVDNVHLYNKKYDFFIGILAGLAICTKQSIGVTLSIVVIVYRGLFIESKQQFKQYFRMVCTRIIGILIPLIVLFVYLISTSSFMDFINYAVLGISEFSNKIPYLELLQNDKIEIKVLSVAVPVSILLMIIIILVKILKRQNKDIVLINVMTMLVYSLSIIIVMYPISDEIHFLIGSFISIIGLIYIVLLMGINVYSRIKYKNKYIVYKIISLIIWILVFSMISTIGIDNIFKYFKVDKNTVIEHYKNIEVQDYLRERIYEIDNYICEREKEGKKVYILDSEACIYMIPLNKYNKNYDMFLKGNIGKDGQDKQIRKITEKDENELYLIRNRNLSLNWQTPTMVIDYIRENLEFVEEVSIYEVYR